VIRLRSRHSAVTILAALLAVLTLASSAWAESVWVLWEQQRMVTEPPAIDTRTLRREPAAIDTWTVVDKFVTKTACETRRGQFGEQLSWSDAVTKGFTGTRHVCLPDSEDPRGSARSGEAEPKGK
jgi:hypothetical protein